MATYVNDLRLKEIATGDESGTWGTSTNTNLELIGEALGYSTEGITTNADTHTTTVADGSTDPGRAMYIKYTGTLDSACTITIGPNTMSRVHIIENATSGSQNIIIKQGSGAEVTIANGFVKAVYLDGAGSGAAVTEAFTDLSVGGNLLIDGTTPKLTIGDGGAEDTAIVFDGNAKDFYIGLDDSADKLVIGEGSTVGTNNILTITDDTVTIGDGAAADTSIVFDGNAQDFYIGLDDSADDLIIGLGSTVGTTPIISVDENKDVAIPDGKLTITESSSFGNGLILKNTSNTHGSILLFNNDSSSPADGDYIGSILFNGNDSAGNSTSFGKIFGRALDVTDGTEDGEILMELTVAGSSAEVDRFNSSEAVFNDSSQDIDFRVESDGNANMLFVDAGNDSVGIATSATGSTGSLVVKANSGAGAISLIGRDNGGISTISFYDDDGSSNVGYVQGRADDDQFRVWSTTSDILSLGQNNIERIRLTDSEVVVNEVSRGDNDFRVESDSNTHALFVDASADSAGFLKSSFTIGTDGFFVGSNGGMSITALQGTTNSESVIYCNRRGNPGDLIKFYKDGTEVGRIRTDGSTTTYVTDVSDLREKKNFESWDEKVLPYFAKLNPQKFHTLDQEDDSEKKKGYIAQELFESFPEAYPLTNMGDDGDYRERHQYSPGNMVVYLMKAIQEQQEQIEELKAEVAKLKGE